MVKPSLQSTQEYGRFELCQFNRNVTKTKNLERSMKRHGFIPAYPIHCDKRSNGSLLIKAGHHRFEVAQRLGIPLYYVVSDDDATIHELETSTNGWTSTDYMESFIKCGKPSYQELKDYHIRTQIPLSVCI